MRALVEAIRDESVRVARVQASLVRLRAEALQIALDHMARSSSRDTREREMPVRSLALEIAVATHNHDLTVQKELSDAHTLTVAALSNAPVPAPRMPMRFPARAAKSIASCV